MKSREEYLASIYAKRDVKLANQKKTISVIISMTCLVICFISVFSFVPKKFSKKTSTTKPVNVNSYSISQTIDKIIPEDNKTLNQFAEQFTFDAAYVINKTAVSVTNPAEANVKDGVTSESCRKDSLKTEIAIEDSDETTSRNMNFGYVGEPFDPDRLLSGGTAIAPENPPEDYVTAVTGSDYKNPDSVDQEKTIAKTSAAKPKSTEEAVAAAKNFLQNEDAADIIDEKTQVTITRRASGNSTYTVYFYTDNKSFKIELDAVTLRVIGCTEKNLISGTESHISPPWFPETTEALPEYKPQ